MVYIIMIALIIILINENKKLSDENKYLRRINANTNTTPNSINNIQFVSNTISEERIPASLENNNSKMPDKKIVNEKELKNNAILITGSIMVILASIIFLMSSWYSIHNIIKTLIIVSMLGIFLLSSHIADKYLNLKQTSKAFYYIALTYIPLALLSISIFELFGKYLSFYGAGKYVYLSISSLVVSVIYYLCNKNRKSFVLSSVNIFFVLLTIMLGILIFTDSFKMILIGFMIFGIIYSINYIKNCYFVTQKYHLISSSIITFVISILSLYNIYDYLRNSINLTNIILNTLLLLNIYLTLIKVNCKKDVYDWLYPILTIQIAYNVVLTFNSIFIVEQLLIIAASSLIYIFDIYKEKKIKWSTFIEIIICLFIVFTKTIDGSNTLYLSKEIMLLTSLIFTFINYYFDNKNKFVSACFLITNLNIFFIISLVDFPRILPLYVILGTIVLARVINKIEINLKKVINNIGNVFICFLAIFMDLDLFYLLFTILYMIVNYYIGHIENKVSYRILSYIFLNIMLNNFFIIINLDINELVIPLTTTIIMIIEKFNPCEQTKLLKVYMFLQFIISFGLLISINEIYSFIVLIVLNICYLKYINDYNLNEKLIYVSNFTLIPFIYTSNILNINNFNYMYPISLGVLMLYAYLSCKTTKNQYIITYFVYTIFHVFSIENNQYIEHIIFLIGFIIGYIVKEGKIKDLFKALIYTILLSLYYVIIEELKLIDISIFNKGILFIYLLLLTRTIIKKYIKEYKVFEYILGIVINNFALINYTSELDGLIFVLGLVFLLMISYAYKYGPIFVISLIFIILNVLILTRAFWLSIPWWIYILLIGTILIAFAIYNEIKQKENNEITQKIDNIKKNLDM